MKADGQSLESKDRCREVCCIIARNTSSEPELIETQDAAECQKHRADVGTRGGRV